MTIQKAVLEDRNGFKFPVVTVKNLGGKSSTAQFMISATIGTGTLQWQENSTIPAGSSVDSRGTGFILDSGITQITFIVDSLNQTQDINRANNIFVYPVS